MYPKWGPWFYPYEDLAKSENRKVQIFNHGFILISCYSLEPDIEILWYIYIYNIILFIFSLTSGVEPPKNISFLSLKVWIGLLGKKFGHTKKGF